MTWKERRDALREEIQTGDSRAAILACLRDSNRRVRQEGIRNVGSFLDDPEILDALTLRLNDRSRVVRREMVSLTPKIGLKAAPMLLELCKSATGENLTLTGESLAALAEAHPDPALRQGAARLRRRTRGWFLTARVRSTLISSATRIEIATEGVKDLPRSAESNALAKSLPVPTRQSDRTSVDLPVPSELPKREFLSPIKCWWRKWWRPTR